jgi:chromosomal replication initiation ATPase DnaA
MKDNWTEDEICNFISQLDLLRNYHKEFNIKEKLIFFKKYGSLIRTNQPIPVNISIKKIEDSICFYYTISSETLSSKKRKGDAMKYRQIFQYFLRNFTKMTLNEIAEYCGYDLNKTGGHTVVLYNVGVVVNRFEIEPKYRNEIIEIRDLIKII